MAYKMRELDSFIGNFKVISDLGMRDVGARGRGRFAIVECPHCDRHYEVDAGKYKNSPPKSCGCRANEFKSVNSSKKTHGESNTRLYNIWEGIKRRVLKPNKKEELVYKNITISPEWMEYTAFRDWSLLNGYRDNLTIDRIDGNGNYEPSNCRWATRQQQVSNRVTARNNKMFPKGVMLNGRNYKATITVDGKVNILGTFKTVYEARNAYNNFILSNSLIEFYPLSEPVDCCDENLENMEYGICTDGDLYVSYCYIDGRRWVSGKFDTYRKALNGRDKFSKNNPHLNIVFS